MTKINECLFAQPHLAMAAIMTVFVVAFVLWITNTHRTYTKKSRGQNHDSKN